MARLVINDSITSRGTLVSGQALLLGNFIMGARFAFKPKTTHLGIGNCLRIDPEYSDKMDPAVVASLNELLDRITALGVATDYD